VYAVLEAKQTVNARLVSYAREKSQCVRRLHQASLPIPHAGGTYAAKPLIPIFGGLFAFESEWSPALSPALLDALMGCDAERRLDIGCIASHWIFQLYKKTDSYELERREASHSISIQADFRTSV
jgi:hypothetical protein